MNKVLCITGMHRSGTSLVSSYLEACGLKLFEKVPPNIGNFLGHHEDRYILDIHAKALRRIDKNTKGWIISKKIKPHLNKQEVLLMKKLVEERSANKLWGWKDPRTTLFLNYWKEIIPNLKVLILWRKYDQVIDSLLRRSHMAHNLDVMKITLNQAVVNWKLYNDLALRYYKKYHKDTLILKLDAVVKKGEKLVNILNSEFNLPLIAKNFDYYFHPESMQRLSDLHYKIPWYVKRYFKLNNLEQRLIKHSYGIDE